MVKGGALLYAMFLMIVITIITSSFILYNYLNSTYILQSIKQEKAYQDIHSAINFGITNNNIPYNENIDIDLYNEGNSVEIIKKSWGAFIQLTANRVLHNKTISKTALVGARYKDEDSFAIYLCDQNKPLAITGATKIIGDCYLPEKGIERAYIEGKSYSGTKLIYGNKKNSNKNIPKLNEKLITENENHLSFNLSDNDSVIAYETLIEVDTIHNDFSNKVLVLYSPYSIAIDNISIQGNIIIKSEKNIIISSTSNVEDIICYARGILVERNSSITGQFFASDSIITEEDCEFKYPSVLALIHTEKNKQAPKLILGENNHLKGSVFLFKDHFNRKKQALLAIGEDSEILGNIYSSEQLELRGKVTGSVACRNFILKTPSSVYENHLMDVSINRRDFPNQFLGASLLEEISNYNIIKWLN